MKKQNIILIIIGIILIIAPYFLTFYSIFRMLSVLLGIIFLLLGLIIDKKKKLIRIIFWPIIIIGLVLFWDFSITYLFKSVPVIAFSHKSSDKVSTYNSIFFRVFDCENVLTFDANYEKDYLCTPEAISPLSINKFLENPQESYQESKGKFVHLEGKISTIVGNSSLTLDAYEDNIELNGYVEFNTQKKVVVEGLDIDPSEYYIYDFIEVVGLVEKIKENNDEIAIYLKDAIIIKSSLYNEYELLVNNINDPSKVKVDEKIYYLGLQGIFYKYDENNIYEIDYLLLDKRESIENLIGEITPNLIKDVHKLYELANYNLIICDNEDIIFANKDITNLKEICDSKRIKNSN